MVRGSAEWATGSVLLAHFSDANPQATLADFSATVAWGDGDSEAGIVQVDSQGGFDVLANHVYADGGVYAVQVTFTDDGGAVAPASGSATINILARQSA